MEVGDWVQKVQKTSKRYQRRVCKGVIIDNTSYNPSISWCIAVMKDNAESTGTPRAMIHKRVTSEDTFQLETTTLTTKEFEIAFKLGALKG